MGNFQSFGSTRPFMLCIVLKLELPIPHQYAALLTTRLCGEEIENIITDNRFSLT
jgi:hypothetical protein